LFPDVDSEVAEFDSRDFWKALADEAARTPQFSSATQHYSRSRLPIQKLI